MDATKKLCALFRAGWGMQVIPMVSAWGVIEVTVVWSRKRSEVDEMVEGAAVSRPMVMTVNLADPDGWAKMVAEMYGWVYPAAPEEPGADDLPAPFREL